MQGGERYQQEEVKWERKPMGSASQSVSIRRVKNEERRGNMCVIYMSRIPLRKPKGMNQIVDVKSINFSAKEERVAHSGAW